MSKPTGRVEPGAPEFKPFVPPGESPRELTVRAVVIGSLLGIVFAASSVYLGLKVGLTVSASIPVAVLSITLFRWMGRAFGMSKASILENNVVQTTGSAGESIAAGVAFTLPSLLLMGFDMELERILLVGLLGGLIGVLMMIPLRQGLIVQEHGKLMYPEGTACADVLIVGEKGGTSAATVFLGFFVGLFYTIANLILRLWADVSTFAVDFWGKLRGATLSFEVSPPMLGVGYIIGPRTAANMMAGGALAFLILVPLVHLFGDASNEVFYPADRLIRDMSPGQIRNNFILYIGAGAVATGGFIALARSIPSIVKAFRGGLQNLKQGAGSVAVKRTERDLSMKFVLGGSLAIALAIWLAPMLEINLVSAVLIVLFGFFFVTVSSRITGEIGSSSNPISGMTVATLLLTCGLFVLVGWTGVGFKAMALTTAALVCVAASNGGTISQDLKTGFLVGATPRAQQLSILVGVVTSAIVIGYTLKQLNQGSTTYKPVDFGPGVSLAAHASPGQTDARADGTPHGVAYVHEDEGPVQRGKYLIDASGEPLFLVDPGVCGTFPYTFQRLSEAGVVSVPADAPSELGPDRQSYKRVELAESQGALERGLYLVGADGRPAYRMNKGEKFDAPKAQLFRLIIDGTLGGKLPWGLVLVGMFLAIIMELVGVASLPFAVGLYLPISTSAGIFVGGMVRWLVERRTGKAGSAESEFSPGTLMASGLIAGGAIAGVIQSVIAWKDSDRALQGLDPIFTTSSLVKDPHLAESWWPLFPFLLMALGLYIVGTRKERGHAS
jgi:putative OPT family oligopeptide transporter